MGCNLKFHNKKEKLDHHILFEPECKAERNSLIDLLGKYKAAIFELAKENDITMEELMKNEDFEELRKEIESTSKKLLDSAYFNEVLGEDLIDGLIDKEEESVKGESTGKSNLSIKSEE